MIHMTMTKEMMNEAHELQNRLEHTLTESAKQLIEVHEDSEIVQSIMLSALTSMLVKCLGYHEIARCGHINTERLNALGDAIAKMVNDHQFAFLFQATGESN